MFLSLQIAENGKEILSMNEVMNYLLRSSKLLCDQADLATLLALPDRDWQKFVDEVRGMIVTYPGMVSQSSSVYVSGMSFNWVLEGVAYSYRSRRSCTLTHLLEMP